MARLRDTTGDGIVVGAPGGLIRPADLETIPTAGNEKTARDPLADMQRAIRLAQRQAPAPAGPGGIRVNDFDFSFDGLAVTNVGRLLKLARTHLGNQEYAPALAAVEELLREQPKHPDGLYLKAVCHHALGQHRDGLKALAALRAAKDGGANVVPRLESEATDLRVKLWAGIAPTAMSENYERLQNNQIAELLDDAGQLLAIDPLVWEFHYLKAEGQFAADDASDAWATVAAAIDLTRTRPVKPLTKPPEALVTLRERIRTHRARVALARARDLYRYRDYGSARAVVARLDSELRAAPLVPTFDAYLARLIGPPAQTPRTADPEGTPAEVEALYFFLAGEEMMTVRWLAMAGRHREAVEAIRELLPYMPHFPYLRFLFGVSVYQGLMAAIDAKDYPPLEEMRDRVLEAHEHAEAAKADPDVTESATALASAFERLRGIIDEAIVEQEKIDQDMKFLQPCVDEFNAIMDAAEAGVSNPAEVDQLTARATKLLSRLPSVKQFKAESSAGFRGRLKDAIDKMLAELRDLRGRVVENEKVGQLWSRLRHETEDAKHSLTQFTVAPFASRLHSISQDAKRLRATLSGENSRKSVDELIDTLRQILTQVGYGHYA